MTTATDTAYQPPIVVNAMRKYETSVLLDMVTWCDNAIAGHITPHGDILTVHAMRAICEDELNDRATRIAADLGRDQ